MLEYENIKKTFIINNSIIYNIIIINLFNLILNLWNECFAILHPDCNEYVVVEICIVYGVLMMESNPPYHKDC